MGNLISKKREKTKIRLPETWILIMVIIGMSVLVGGIKPVFFTFTNITNIIISISVMLIIGIGMTMIMLMADIDVSVGGTLALSAVICGSLLTKYEAPIVVAIAVALLVGTAVGAFNGFCNAILGIPSLIVTLATLSITRGLVLIYTKAKSTFGFPNSFNVIGQGKVLGIPVPILITIVLVGVAVFVLRFTSFGRSIYAIGNNPNAAIISGIRIKKIKIIVFSITGFLCALSGLTVIARMDSAAAVLATGVEFQVITAVVIGGTSIFGGRGSIGKTVIGVIIVGIIINGLQLLHVSVYYTQFISGLILLFAVSLDMLRQRRRLAV